MSVNVSATTVETGCGKGLVWQARCTLSCAVQCYTGLAVQSCENQPLTHVTVCIVVTL